MQFRTKGTKLMPDVDFRGSSLASISAFENGVGEAGEESWVLSLSDLMTLLLIFFLVWATFEIKGFHNAKTGQGAKGFEHEEVRSVLRDLKGLTPLVSKKNDFVLVLPEGECFEHLQNGPAGIATGISKKGLVTLNRLAQVLKKEDGYEITVAGHVAEIALDSGVEAGRSNIELSLARAGSVFNTLASLGIDPRHMQLKALGAMEPVDISEKDIRPDNSRVEIEVSWKRP